MSNTLNSPLADMMENNSSAVKIPTQRSAIDLNRREVVSKPQVRLKSKTQADEKAQSRQRRDEQYILKRFATQLLGLRWGFEITSRFWQRIREDRVRRKRSLPAAGQRYKVY